MRLLHFAPFAALAVLVSCAHAPVVEVYLDNPAFLKDNLSHTYAASREKCYAATLAALKDLHTPVQKADPATGKIITERAQFFDVVTSHAHGDGYGNATATASEIKQEHKLYLEVTGDAGGSSCQVSATKYQMWTNNIEAVSTTASSLPWAHQNVWDPFFKSIQDQLAIQ